MTESNNKQPVDTKQFDRVRAAIWRQEADAEKANDPFYTFTVSRSYKDANGTWQRTSSFSSRDLPHLALAVEWAMRELLLKAG